MKITHDLRKFTKFEDLNEGDVFKFNKVFYMKIPPIHLVSGAQDNAIDLEQGHTQNFDIFADVLKIDAELLVKTLDL